MKRTVFHTLARLDAAREKFEREVRAILDDTSKIEAEVVNRMLGKTRRGRPPSKPLHWTQRPENAAKARAWKRAMTRANRARRRNT